MGTTQDHCRRMILEARHPVAIFSMGLGDHLLVLPAVRALAQLFEGRLSLICEPRAKDDFFRGIAFRRIYNSLLLCGNDPMGQSGERFFAYDICDGVEIVKAKPRHAIFNSETIAREVQDCDVFFCLNGWHSPSLDDLIERLSPKVTLGFSPGFQIQLPRRGKHSIDLFFGMPQYLDANLEVTDFAGGLEIFADIDQWARQWRASLPTWTRILAVHEESKPNKIWPAEKLQRVLEGFLDRHEEFIVVALGLNGAALNNGEHRNRLVTCYNKPLACAFGLVAQADLFVGVDSCMLHAADLFRIPGLGLFGPTKPSEFGFRFGPHRHLVGRDQTMESIDEIDVLDALESLCADHVTEGICASSFNPVRPIADHAQDPQPG